MSADCICSREKTTIECLEERIEKLEEQVREYQQFQRGEMMPQLPLDIECPRCGAKVGHSCFSRGRTGTWAARTHVLRWKAIGIEKPTPDDRSRDYWDFKKRQQERILAAHPTRQQVLSR